MAKTSIVIVGQTPPPWHGQAVATAMLFEHRWQDLDVACVRMAYSDEMERIGKVDLRKIRHLWQLVRETRRLLKARPGSILLYPPASPHWVPFLRDVAYLSCVRYLAGKTAFIFHAGGFGEFMAGSRVRSWLARKAYGRPELCLEVAKEEVPPHRVLSADRWCWTPYGIEVPGVSRVAKGPEDPAVVLFVGSLQEGKGVLEVLRTAAVLKGRGKEGNFRFRLVGKWFSEGFRKKTLALVSELGVGGMVEFPGQLTGDEKWEAFRRADIFFFPTHYASEAFPIVVIEALGSGLPVVATDWRGVPSIVEGCGVAEILPIRQPEAFADGLLSVRERLGDAPGIAEKARGFYEGRYLPAHFLKRVEDELHVLAPSSPEDHVPGRPNSPGHSLEVLQVFNQYLERGGEELWVDEVLRLAPEDVRVSNLRFQSRTWTERGKPSRLRQARLLWNNPGSRERLREEVIRMKPDALVFHNVLPVGSFGVYEEASSLGIPVVQYIHNFRPFSPSGTLWVNGRTNDGALRGKVLPEVVNAAWEGSFPRTALLAWYLARFRRRGGLDLVRRWVAVSEFMRSKFIEAGIPPERIVTLRHCWQPRNTDPQAEEGDYYLFLGRLVTEKGLPVLLESWRRLEATMGPACPRLIIAGTGPEEARVHNQAMRSRSVRFVGFVTGQQKAELLRHCRGLIMPSIWWEPLGLTVYEAYDFHRPVLAARSGGLVETVIHGRTGLLHEPGSVDSLVESLKAAEELGSRSRAKMGIRGRRWLEKEACPDTWGRAFKSVLDQALDRG